MIIKNTDPYKIKKCISCKRNINLNEKFFSYPLSLQQICFSCAKNEIPKTIDILNKDLKKMKRKLKKFNKEYEGGLHRDIRSCYGLCLLYASIRPSSI